MSESVFPKISVVTVSYNAVTTIEETILSVVNQTYKNIEYIIIDGGSTDGTVDIIKKYADRIDYWISEPDKGIYDAMNKGIKVATGEWVNFMNSGDVFCSGDTIAMIMSHSNNEDIIYGNIIRCYEKYQSRARGIVSQYPKTIDFLYDTIHHQSAFIKCFLFEKYGYYSTQYKLISDWIFFYETIVRYSVSIHYVNQDIAYFQMNGISTKCATQYYKERTVYLQNCLGKDIYDNLVELHSFRSCYIANKCLQIKEFFKGFSFLRLLVLKYMVFKNKI